MADPMADYDFYRNVYLGTRIPEKAFPEMEAKAQRALNRFRRVFQMTPAGEAEIKLALCAMAETFYEIRRRGGVKSSRVGNVSVQYDGNGRSLAASLLESAGIYLDFYRGVEE